MSVSWEIILLLEYPRGLHWIIPLINEFRRGLRGISKEKTLPYFSVLAASSLANKAEAADTQEKYQAAIAEVKKVSEELTSKSTELESIKAEMHKMEEEEKKKKRKEKLVEAGLSVEEAQEKSESLASLSDEQFAVVAETLFNLKPEVKEEEVVAEEAESEAQTEAEEITADEEVLETASEVEDVALSIAGESTDEKLGTVRANLQEWVTKRVLNKTGE